MFVELYLPYPLLTKEGDERLHEEMGKVQARDAPPMEEKTLVIW